MLWPAHRLLFLSLLIGAAGGPLRADEPDVRELLAQVGISKGICSVPDCGTGALARSIAGGSDLLVHAFDSDRQMVDQARAGLEPADADDRRIVVEWLANTPLPYPDNFVDLIVVDRQASDLQVSDVGRVLRPRGCALIRGHESLVKSLRQGGFAIRRVQEEWQVARKPEDGRLDDWSHWYHRPDNNPVSEDRRIQSPYLTQWLAAPYYHAMPVVSTAAAGRVFVASGHIAHHDREIPTLNTLVARNGYNGRVLWRRTLPPGYLVHRSAFVATRDVFYMIDGNSILKMDPESGRELERLRIPDVAGSLKWLAKVDNMMYVLAGQIDPPTQTAKVHATFRGWAWSKVDANYSPQGKHQIRWGFGDTLAAYDLRGKKLIWTRQQPGVDSRGMGILGDKLFYYVPGRKLACINRQTGELLWANEDTDKLSLIEEEARGLPGTPGFRTSAMLLATPVGLFLQGQKRMNVLGFALDDGQFLWSKRKYHNNPNMLYAQEKLFISGIEQNGAVQVIDPRDGHTLENLNFWKGSCTRMTGSPEGLYCRGEGLGRFDFARKIYTSERSARPGCNDGAIAANGLLYVGPWLCDCNLSILGQLALGPARGFDAQSQVVSPDSLQSVTQLATEESAVPGKNDWPTYRANNMRSGATPAGVRATARLLWRCPPPRKAALQCQPVLVGGRLFTADQDGLIRCLDSRSGAEHWRYATGGPVLASPTVWQGRLLVGSGDGYVYCLNAEQGNLLWRFRAAPVERRMMVYGHLASTWPVNSGVLVHQGTAYAAAGIMFRDGTHVVALDARSGRLRWHNGSIGNPLNDQFELHAGSAQGSLAIGRGRLWLAAGNVVAPVSFDLKTGEADVQPAQRVPVWNTVMAQKPEPAGRDIMVFQDRYLLHGGRLLYSGEGQVVSAAQVNFRLLDPDGRLQGPAFTPVRHCAIPPVWDDGNFVTPTSRYGDIVCWDTADVEQHLAAAVQTMTNMDQTIPGDTPEKWGQYNLIGRVFSTVERQLRKTGKFPAIRQPCYALALAENGLVLTGSRGSRAATYFVAAYSRDNGALMWEVELPSQPRLEGLAIGRDGRVAITLADGAVACVGE